jgi:hypothetical protein
MGRKVGSKLGLLLAGAVLVGGLVAVGQRVRAGDGTIAIARDPAGNFDQGRLTTKVFVDAPRSQEMRDRFELQMRVANRLICDYTDGRFRLERLNMVRHPAEKRNSDIWWFNFPDRAYAQLGTYGRGAAAGTMCGGQNTMRTDLGRLTIYSFDRDLNDGAPDTPEEGQTIAHELGHLVFGLGDQYQDQGARDTGTPRGAGISGLNLVVEPQSMRPFFRTFVPFTIDGPAGTDTTFFQVGRELKDLPAFTDPPPKKDGSPLYGGAMNVPWWLQNNTIMQQADGLVCARDNAALALDGQSKRNENPVLFLNFACRTDTDCPGGYRCFRAGPMDVSPLGTAMNSELSVTQNHDQDRFNLTASAAVAAGPGAGHIQEARHLVVQGFLWPSAGNTIGPAFVGGGDLDNACPRRSATNVCECPVDSAGEGSFGAMFEPGGEIFTSGEGADTSADCPYGSLPGTPAGTSTAVGCLRVDHNACPARLGTVVPAAGGPFCGDGTVTIDAANNIFEQCDNGNNTANSVNPNVPLVDPRTGQPLRCEDLWSERIARNFSGVRVPIVPSRLRGGVVHCGRNCNLDLSRCAVDLAGDLDQGTDNRLSLRELRAQSQGWTHAEVFDRLGQVQGNIRPNVQLAASGTFPEGGGVNLSEIGPSNHIVFTSLRRMYRYLPNGWDPVSPDWRDVWELRVAMDAAEFGGVSGEARIIRSFDLEFDVDHAPGCTGVNCGPLVRVNGVPYTGAADQATWPLVYLGFGDDKMDQWGGQPRSGAFARGDASNGLELRIDLRNLTVQRVRDENNTLRGLTAATFDERRGPVISYARHALKDIGGRTFEVPQYADINFRFSNRQHAEFFDRFGFNSETQRYESSQMTLDHLAIAQFGQDTPSPGFPKSAPVADLVNRANEFIHSDWNVVDKVLCNKWGVNVPVPGAAVDLGHAPPDLARCPDPMFDWGAVGNVVDFNQDTQIVFVLDRSGSMSLKNGSLAEEPGSRLDYVKNAGHVFMHTMIANMRSTAAPFGPKIGLVYYSDGAEVRIGGADPAVSCTDANAAQVCTKTNHSKTCLNGKCKFVLPSLSETAGADRITVDELRTGHMRIGRPGIVEEPRPDGFTASGLGLQAGIKLFDPRRPGGPEPTKIIMFLTDGQHNRPTGGRCRDGRTPYRDEPACWPGANAEKAFQDALTEIENQNILIFDVPLANEVDPATASIRAGRAGGEVFQASRPLSEDAIPAFFSASAAALGQQVARSHNALPNEFVPAYGESSPYVSYFVDVEPGARALKLVISDYDSTRDGFDLRRLIIFPPAGPPRFFDPSQSTPQQPIDPLSGSMFIENPTPGRWTISHDASQERTLFYVAAQVDNPAPSCFAQVNNTTVKPGEVAMITAQAVFNRPVVSGAHITGKLLRADKILVDLTFTADPRTPGLWKALVDPADLVGRGQYIATVSCDVEQDAELASGEVLPGMEDQPVTPQRASKFSRQMDVTFFLDSSTVVVPGLGGNTQPPGGINGLPPGFAPVNPFVGDADGDGIPNGQEPPPSVDTDGDGNPDVNDPDGNGNEVPDGQDPAVCRNPPCLRAVAGPDQVLECSNNVAVGTLDGRASTAASGALSFAWSSSVPLQNANTAVATGTFTNAATTTATLAVTDSTGSATDTTQLTVLDLTPPTISKPADVTTSSCTVPGLATPAASDGCGGTVTVMREPPVGFKFPVGTTTVTWFAIDRFGNVATTTQKVTVNVTGNPTLTQPSNKTFTSCAAGSIGVATAADACGVALTPTSDAPARLPVGTTTVTWRATDNRGRTVSKTQTVTINLSSTPRPTLTPPADITVNSCGVPQLGTATGADACGAPVTITSNAPARFGVGTTTVTWTARDRRNQTTTATQRVTINLPASSPPILNVPAAVTVTSCSNPPLGTATAVDACGAPLPVTKIHPAKLPLGLSFVTWSTTDGAGFTTTRAQRVTVDLADDSSCCPAGTTIRNGTSSAEVLTGTSGRDCILGKGGDDVITGVDGDDYLSGGAGNDNINGGNGTDRLWGGPGQNVLHGGDGDDSIYGNTGADNGSGGAGTDYLECRDGDDNCSGGEGDDTIVGGNGKDVLAGEGGNDRLLGEGGDDRLQGGPGFDFLDGGPGTDTCEDAADTAVGCAP